MVVGVSCADINQHDRPQPFPELPDGIGTTTYPAC